MPVWSLVHWSGLDRVLRLDAEYYSPENLRLQETLYKSELSRLHDFADVSDGIHASPDSVDSGGILYLSAKCVKENAFALGDTLRISKQQNNENARSQLKDNDIVVTTVGTIGNAAVATRDLLPANVDRHVGIIRIRPRSDYDPWFVSTFLNSKYGRFQTLRESTGNVQLNLFIVKINELLIPQLDCAVEVARMTREGYEAGYQASIDYVAAETELLDRLGWSKLAMQEPELHYMENHSHVAAAERCDAEHFQPRYHRLRKHLQEAGALPLSDLWSSCDKGTQPDEYTDAGEVVVVKSKDVFGQGVKLEECERTSLLAWGDASARLNEGDLVVNSTGRGTLGRAATIGRYASKVVASVDLLICRLDQEKVSSHYVSLFLNSPAGLAQSEQFQTGSSGQLHLYPYHLGQFLIYLPPSGSGVIDRNWQERLADKVMAASDANAKARLKLDDAKALVEHEIERRI